MHEDEQCSLNVDGKGKLIQVYVPGGTYSLSEDRLQELKKMFCSIVSMLYEYVFPIDMEDKKNCDSKYILFQKEIRKNVDEAIFKVIEKNPEILFIKVKMGKGSYQPLWSHLLGNESDLTLLPKTMEFIMRHPIAPLIQNSGGIVLPWFVDYNNYFILNLVAEHPKCRTLKNDKGANLAINLVKSVIGNSRYKMDNSFDDNYGIELVDKFLNYSDCSLQQDQFGDNIGAACANKAIKLLKKYCLKTSNFDVYWEDKYKCHSEDACRYYYNLARELQMLAYKSIAIYPESAQQTRIDGKTLNDLYEELYDTFIYIEKEPKGVVKKDVEEIKLFSEVPSVDVLYKKLSLK